MRIKQYMTPDPITVAPEVTLPQARKILNTYHIRHLPVVGDEGDLAGIVTDRDLRSAYPSSVTTKKDMVVAFEQVEKTVVADIMTTNCATLSPESTIDDALVIFDRDKIGGIPVVNEDERIVGIFSLLDLTAAYRQLFGLCEVDSLLVGLKDDGRPTIISELTALLENKGGRLSHLLRLRDGASGASIYLRLNTSRPADLVKALKNGGFQLLEGWQG